MTLDFPQEQQVAAAEFKFDAILYGASYYLEYMPEERLEKDIELMLEAGLNMVRLGDSAWSLLEPHDGAFEVEWLDRIIDAFTQAGIAVILVTPTYSLPLWMARKYPEILADRWDGSTPTYGMRQNMDTDHAAYRYYCQRIVRRLVEHYRNHPGVIAWQIDNETASYGAANHDVFVGFVDWLKQRYGTLERLNKAWLTNFWGQTIFSWEEFARQNRAQSTAYRLDWTRWQKQRVTNFLAFQSEIVREYRRSDQFILQDHSLGLHKDVDEAAIAPLIDFVGINPYYRTQDRMDGHTQAYCGDYYRSLKNKNYLVTEINAQTIGWNSAGQFPPYDNQARLDVYSNIASGANMIAYWHWHTLHSGQETYWKGVLGHDLEKNRFYDEIKRTAGELTRLGDKLVNLKKSNRVAILYSGDSQNALDIMPITHDGHPSASPFETHETDYQALLLQLHKTIYELNVDCDIIPVGRDLSPYNVLVVPALYIASDEQLDGIGDFVSGGGHVLATFKTGFANEDSFVRPARAPGPLRTVGGFSYQEFSNLREPVHLRGIEGTGAHWAEMLIGEGAEIVANYDDPFLSAWAAVTTNRYGEGRFTYMGTWLDMTAMTELLRKVLDWAGVAIPSGLPQHVRLRRGTSASGSELTFVLNYSPEAFSLHHSGLAGRELLSDRIVGADSSAIEIEPWGVAIIEH